jgi:integrase
VVAGAAQVGLPDRWGFHGLRHYFATLLIHGGASVKTVQLALGHSSPTVTLNEYVHEWPDVLDRTRALVDAALFVRETAATSAVSRA